MTDGAGSPTTEPGPPLDPEVIDDLVALAAAPGASLVTERVRELLRELVGAGVGEQVRRLEEAMNERADRRVEAGVAVGWALGLAAGSVEEGDRRLAVEVAAAVLRGGGVASLDAMRRILEVFGPGGEQRP